MDKLIEGFRWNNRGMDIWKDEWMDDSGTYKRWINRIIKCIDVYIER